MTSMSLTGSGATQSPLSSIYRGTFPGGRASESYNDRLVLRQRAFGATPPLPHTTSEPIVFCCLFNNAVS